MWKEVEGTELVADRSPLSGEKSWEGMELVLSVVRTSKRQRSSGMGKGGRVLLPNGRSSLLLESPRKPADDLDRVNWRLSNTSSTCEGEPHEAGRRRGVGGLPRFKVARNPLVYRGGSDVSKEAVATPALCAHEIGTCSSSIRGGWISLEESAGDP